MTTVDDQQSGFAMRVALAKVESRRDAADREEILLRVVALTLAWLVLLALLLGWGLTGGAGRERYLAAMVAVGLPFVTAVMATRRGYLGLAGVYIVLTLVMIVPALGMVA